MDYGKEKSISQQLNRTVNLQRILNIIAIVLFIFVIFGGVTILSPLRKQLLIAGSCFCLLSFIVANMKLRALNLISFLWFVSISYMAFGSFLSQYSNSAIPYFISYVCCFVAMITGFSKDDYILFIKIAEVVAVIAAITIILEIVIQPLFTNILSFIYPAGNRAKRIQMITSEIHQGSYSGFLGEKGEAAFAMNILVSIELCKMFAKKSTDRISVFLLLLGIISLMLTGKRTLFIIPFFICVLFVIVNKIKGKYIKIAIAACIVALAFYIAILAIPQAGNIFNRLFESNDNTLSGRDVLWDACSQINSRNPLFGTGLGTFTEWANNIPSVKALAAMQGFESWTAQAHSMYYQFYAELGIIGSILVLGTIGFVLTNTILFKSKIPLMNLQQKIIYHFSLYFQVWFVIYGLTGNVGHYPQDLIIYFMSVGMYLYVSYALSPLRKQD